MRAEHHDFIGLFASANFGNRVVNSRRPIRNCALDIHLHFHRPAFHQPPNQAVAFRCNKRSRNRRDCILPSAQARHIQQPVRLPRIRQARQHSFLLEEFIARHDKSAKRRIELARLLPRPQRPHQQERIAIRNQHRIHRRLVGRRQRQRFARDHDRAFQFALVLIEVLRLFGFHIHHPPAHRPLRICRPTVRCNRQRMLRRCNNPRRRRPARPYVRNRPGFQVRIPEPIVGKFLFRPFIRLLQILRARQSLPDHVRKIFQVRHDLVVVMHLRQNLFVRSSKLIFRRRCALLRPQRYATPCNHHRHHNRHKSAAAKRFHLRFLHPVRTSFENIRFYARRTTNPSRFQSVLTSHKVC